VFTPSNFIIFVGLIRLLLTAAHYRSAGRSLLAVYVAAFLFCGFSPLANLLMVPLEMRFPVWKPEGAEPDGLRFLEALLMLIFRPLMERRYLVTRRQIAFLLLQRWRADTRKCV
jgi:hypothetical protein